MNMKFKLVLKFNLKVSKNIFNAISFALSVSCPLEIKHAFVDIEYHSNDMIKKAKLIIIYVILST